MSTEDISVRIMGPDDFDAIVEIDRKVLGESRLSYYEMKFDKLVLSADCVPTSLVATDSGGKVLGFIMGELYVGEYGMQEAATLDTIGVDPEYQKQGIGEKLIEEFLDHLGELGAKKIITLVDPEDRALIRFLDYIREFEAVWICKRIEIARHWIARHPYGA